MRLVRPYIPLWVRAQVAERQLFEKTRTYCTDAHGVPLCATNASMRVRLDAALFHLSNGGTVKLELHHRPALTNRPWIKRLNDYDPPANDPEHLFYLPDADHDIETRVRGVGAQRSDLAQRRYLKRVARNREKPAKPRRKANRPKHRWASRPLRSASQWPSKKRR